MQQLTWLTTRSVTPVLSCPLLGAIESNSSKKRRQGAAAAALANKSRTWNEIIVMKHENHLHEFENTHSILLLYKKTGMHTVMLKVNTENRRITQVSYSFLRGTYIFVQKLRSFD